jgi:hypothetical protein
VEIKMDFKKIAENNRILEIRVGSHLFGTTTSDSDIDYYGIFMPNEEMVYGFQQCNEVDFSVVSKDASGRNTADAVDRKLHEFRKFTKLALQNNPNILHVLFVDKPNIVFANNYGLSLLDNAHLFPHKGAHLRFVKYADSQRHKMCIRPANYAKLEQGLRILEDQPHNKVMSELKDMPPFEYTKGNHLKIGDIHIEITFYVKKARKMIRERLSKATNRAEMYTKYGYDLKFASNLIQLLMEGIELMYTGKIVMPLTYRQYVLDVKSGKYKADEIMEWADDLVEIARVAYEQSDLPVEPRAKEIEQFTIDTVKRFLSYGC